MLFNQSLEVLGMNRLNRLFRDRQVIIAVLSQVYVWGRSIVASEPSDILWFHTTEVTPGPALHPYTPTKVRQ